MLIYRFKPNLRTDPRVALTNDQTGAVLPADGAPWTLIGEVDMASDAPWVNIAPAEIEATIAKTGYFIWSISVPTIKKRR